MPKTKPKTKYGVEANRSYTLKEFKAVLKQQAREAKVKGLNRRPETEVLLDMKLRVVKAAMVTDDFVNLLEAEDALLGRITGKDIDRETKAWWEWRQTIRGRMPKKRSITAGKKRVVKA